MLTKAEIRLLTEMVANKDKYLDYIESSDNRSKKLQTIKLYQQIEEAQAQYYSSVGNEALSRSAYANSLKEKKIDPFIIGGATQAIGGVVPGIYAAATAASHNKSIDNSRNIYKSMADNDIITRKVAEEKIRPLIKELDNLLNTEPIIHNYRLDLLEYDYQNALKMKKNKNFFQAREIFISLGDYKDSVFLAAKCIKDSNLQNIMVIGILGGILSLFVLLISGVIFVSIEASLAVFCISFIISFVMIAIMMRRK